MAEQKAKEKTFLEQQVENARKSEEARRVTRNEPSVIVHGPVKK